MESSGENIKRAQQTPAIMNTKWLVELTQNIQRDGTTDLPWHLFSLTPFKSKAQERRKALQTSSNKELTVSCSLVDWPLGHSQKSTPQALFTPTLSHLELTQGTHTHSRALPSARPVQSSWRPDFSFEGGSRRRLSWSLNTHRNKRTSSKKAVEYGQRPQTPQNYV